MKKQNREQLKVQKDQKIVLQWLTRTREFDIDSCKLQEKNPEYSGPDVILNTGSQTIGIELTRLAKPSNPRQAAYSDTISRICYELTDQLNQRKLYIAGGLLLVNPIQINANEKKQLIKYLCDLVEKNMRVWIWVLRMV